MPGLYELVSKFLSVPASNAYVERVFSLISAQWTDVRNLLQVETVKSLAQVKCNFSFNCSDFHKMIISNKKLLNSIVGDKKYNA
uniref:HAT C-terminal dimerisation domain-containing protein n=1 Tax=Meloidogyne incognita TaxID=6306 RepID=A0A914KGK4_MELIC